MIVKQSNIKHIQLLVKFSLDCFPLMVTLIPDLRLTPATSNPKIKPHATLYIIQYSPLIIGWVSVLGYSNKDEIHQKRETRFQGVQGE